MKRTFVFALFYFIVFNVQSQRIFFKSTQTFNEGELGNFYSSIAISGDQLVFNAVDYQVYFYNKRTGKLLWNYDIRRKSDIAPLIANGYVWATTSYGDEYMYTQVTKLDTADGTMVKKLSLSSLLTQPIIKGDILYCTGIYDGGCVLALDMKKDTVLWSRFLAHGCSEQPYYFADKIVANAEGDKWLELSYDGKLLDANCEDSTVTYPSELSCARTFNALTHDKREIKGKLSEELLSESERRRSVLCTDQLTFLLQDAKLTILGNNLKKKYSAELSSFFEETQDGNEYSIILKADDTKVWLVCNNRFIVYNFKTKKAEQVLDLSEWQPHQAVLDEDQLWVISSKDGLLYGITL